ncbi:TPA: hypothetical protein ACK3JW_000349, partial [Mannheimia haemolytica]
SMMTYFENKKSLKVQSYYQKGSYTVFLKRINWLGKILGQKGFYVSKFNSLVSEKYLFPYKVCITPNIGGIARAQTFEIIRIAKYVGTSKTIPIIDNGFSLKKKKWLNKYYAYHDVLSFVETDKFPYFSICNEEKIMSRFHFCIEITDFCNKTEIWYISFSLVLDKDNKGNIIRDTIEDLNVVSPKDLLANLDRVLEFEGDLRKLKAEKNVEEATFKAQLFEMKEYYNFLGKIKQTL